MTNQQERKPVYRESFVRNERGGADRIWTVIPEPTDQERQIAGPLQDTQGNHAAWLIEGAWGVPLEERWGRPGFVYFAEANQGMAIKIGHCMVPRDRMPALKKMAERRWGNPDVRFLVMIEGSYKDEKRMQRQFQRDGTGHEWFKPTADIRSHIKALATHAVPIEWWTATRYQLDAIFAARAL